MKHHLATLMVCVLLTGCFGAPGYEGEAGPHFDGVRFQNTVPLDQGRSSFLGFLFGTPLYAEDWPAEVQVTQNVPPVRAGKDISLTFVNHATFLIQVDGLNILTDPVYSERTSPVSFAGPKRVHVPGVAIEDLPPIDVVLISHNHYDHLDVETLAALAAQQEAAPVVITGLGNRALIEPLGYSEVVELDWEGATRVGDLLFRFTECRHRSGRGMADHFKTLWGSFVVESSAGNLYFAGDTGYGPHFIEAGDAYGPFTLALLPIGAYEPRSFMAPVHLNPAEAVQAHLDLRSNLSVGIHYGTFQLTWEAIDAPLRELADALTENDIGDTRFETLNVGETRTISPDSY